MKEKKIGNFGGKKYDTGKTRWDLIPFDQVEKVAEILTFGAEKYGENNWQNLKKFRSRYFAAMCRHLFAWWGGEKTDSESGKSHLAHAGCCLLFLMWGEDNEKF